MTRYAHVGDLGKTEVQLIRGSKSSINIAQFGEKILYKPQKLSGHHRGNMEDTFLNGIFLGMRLRSIKILIGTTWGVIKMRTKRRRVEEEQRDNEFTRSIKGEPWQLVPGINSDHVPAAISDRAGVHLEEDQADAHLGRRYWSTGSTRSFDATDSLVTQVRSDTFKRMYVTRGLVKKYGSTPKCPGCATIGSHHQASHSDTCREDARRTRKEWRRKRVSCQRTSTCGCKDTGATFFIKPQTCCVRGMGSPTRKIMANGWRGCDNETGCHRHKWCFTLQCLQRPSHGHWKSTVQETSCRCSNRRCKG